MNRNLYHTQEFAKKSSVSVRTIQFYDKKGLLSPSNHTQAGYRLYSDEDLVRLQQVLALKYLGFSLAEIKKLLEGGVSELPSALKTQKQMLLEKRTQVDEIINAIEQLEQQKNGTLDYDAVAQLIRVIQADLKPAWVNKYLTHVERVTMRDIAKQSFSSEALKEIAKHKFTEETHQQYTYFYDELRRLVAHKADPASEEAQSLAQYLMELNRRRSSGWNPEIVAGMKKTWEAFNALPDDKKPQIYSLTMEEREFIKQACTILHAHLNEKNHP